MSAEPKQDYLDRLINTLNREYLEYLDAHIQALEAKEARGEPLDAHERMELAAYRHEYTKVLKEQG